MQSPTKKERKKGRKHWKGLVWIVWSDDDDGSFPIFYKDFVLVTHKTNYMTCKI